MEPNEITDIHRYILTLLGERPARYAHEMIFQVLHHGEPFFIIDEQTGEPSVPLKSHVMKCIDDLKKARIIALSDKGVHRLTESGLSFCEQLGDSEGTITRASRILALKQF